MKKKFISFLVTLILLALVGWIGGFVAYSYVQNRALVFDSSYLFTSYSLYGIGGLYLAWGFIKFVKLDSGTGSGSSSSSSSKTSTKRKGSQEEAQYFRGGWLSIKDMKKRFFSCRFSELRTKSKNMPRDYSGNVGIAVRAELLGQPNKGRDVDLTLVPPVHTIVVGNTRSGKGESFINPNLQVWSELDSKPSMVVTDPKGELYDMNASHLRKRGYDVKVLDLREPFKSDKWNPFTKMFETYQKVLNLKKQVYIHRGDKPSQIKGLKYFPNMNYGDSWFEFNGEAYSTEIEMQTALKGQEQTYVAEITEGARDIASVLIPLDDPRQASWVNGARDFVCAVLFAMLEDSKDPTLGMTKEKFNPYNFYKIVNIKSDDPDDKFATLREYFKGRSALFGVEELANAVTTSGQTTASSYLASLTPAVGIFADPGICFATSDTEMDFTKMVERPTAVFLKIPDEKTTYHKIGGMLITQLYKELTDQATANGGKLKRPVMFMLDEFGNLPKFENMPSYLSVGAGRNIYFCIAVQDFSQLNTTYGDQASKTIKNNCNLKIFIGSNEMQTLKEFNELLGKTTVVIKNETKNKGKDSDSKSESSTEQQRDLMFVEQLQVLPEDHLICVMSKCEPMQTVMTRRHKCTLVYDCSKSQEDFKPTRFLDTDKVTYDIMPYIEKNGGFRRHDDFDF